MFSIGRVGVISGVIALALTIIGLTFASAGPKPPETGADNNSGLSTSRLGF
jgi:hypothetical protein